MNIPRFLVRGHKASEKYESLMIQPEGEDFLVDVIDTFVTPDAPEKLDYFRNKSNALIVPLLPWLRSALWLVKRQEVVNFFDTCLAKDWGVSSVDELPTYKKEFAIAYSFQLFTYMTTIEPMVKQAKLVFDDVFLFTEHDCKEHEVLESSPDLVEEVSDPYNSYNRPKYFPGINSPDIVSVPRSIHIGFMANLLTTLDLRESKLRQANSSLDVVASQLKNINQAVAELRYLANYSELGKYGILFPEWFGDFARQKAGDIYSDFNGSPSIELLMPDFREVPYNEVRDVVNTDEGRELRNAIRGWDRHLGQYKDTDWKKLGAIIKPIMDSMANELEKRKVTKKKAWAGFVMGFLPQPFSTVASASNLLEAYDLGSMFTALQSLRKKV